MIDIEQAEKALEYLKSTDDSAAKAKALYVGYEDMKKNVLAVIASHVEGTSEAKKKREAEASEEYVEHLDKIYDAHLEYEKLRNKRLSATLQIEMWRSCNANQRKGNI